MIPPLATPQGPKALVIGEATDADAASLLSPREREMRELDQYLQVCQMRFASVGADTQHAGELREPAKVCVVNARVRTDAPSNNEALATRVATLLDDEWLVDEFFGKPTVAILVTGGAQDFKMMPRVQRVFREGLVKAAQVTARAISEHRPLRCRALPFAHPRAQRNSLTVGRTRPHARRRAVFARCVALHRAACR